MGTLPHTHVCDEKLRVFYLRVCEGVELTAKNETNSGNGAFIESNISPDWVSTRQNDNQRSVSFFFILFILNVTLGV